MEATLIAHCGTRKITRAELQEIPAPPETDTHKPVSHAKIIEELTLTLSYRGLAVARDEYAVSADGMRMFGVLDLNSRVDGFCYSIGVRNGNDKSMRLSMVAGLRVTVCDPSYQAHRKRAPTADSENGRGLHIIEHLATAWGTDVLPADGKRVWFHLPRCS